MLQTEAEAPTELMPVAGIGFFEIIAIERQQKIGVLFSETIQSFSYSSKNILPLLQTIKTIAADTLVRVYNVRMQTQCLSNILWTVVKTNRELEASMGEETKPHYTLHQIEDAVDSILKSKKTPEEAFNKLQARVKKCTIL